jgi:hypothetical protein
VRKNVAKLIRAVTRAPTLAAAGLGLIAMALGWGAVAVLMFAAAVLLCVGYILGEIINGLRCKNCGHKLANHTIEDSRNYLLCAYGTCKCPGFDPIGDSNGVG